MILRTRVVRALAARLFAIANRISDAAWSIECASDRAQLRAEHARIVFLSDHRGAGKMSG